MANSQTIADLDCLTRLSANESAPAVILIHGFGADMTDLYPLADMIDPDQKWNWYFPNGALDIVIAPGFRGRAWYPIDMARFETALRSGEVHQITKNRSQGMDQASVLLKAFVQELQNKHKRLILGGFSQGAIMSVEVSCLLEKSPDAVVLMSASLVDEENWKRLIPQRKGLAYIQSHGTNDPILSFEGGKKLNSLLNTSGWRGDFVSFTGGHEIPMSVLDRVKSFIAKQLK